MIVSLCVANRWMQHFKMLRDANVSNIYIPTHYYSAFVVPYNYFRYEQSVLLYEKILWLAFIAIMLVRAWWTCYYISEKRSNYTIIAIALLLSSTGLFVYISVGENFVFVSQAVMFACYVLYLVPAYKQYKKIVRNRSCEGISQNSYYIAAATLLLDSVYYIFYGNWYFLPVNIISLFLCVATIVTCRNINRSSSF